MIEKLGPYPEYKESGLCWLGMLPKHWRVLRGKLLFRTVDLRSPAGHEELLTVFKQFQDNAGFKKWLGDTIFSATYENPAV